MALLAGRLGLGEGALDIFAVKHAEEPATLVRPVRRDENAAQPLPL